jgi:hypothetical protein
MISLVKTPDEILAAMPKSQVETTDRFVLAPEDWLVVCGGFEDRALAVLDSAKANNTPFSVMLILYEPFVEQNKAEDIRKICRNGSINIKELSYNREEPAGFGNALVEALSLNDGRIFIDISGMSRLLIVQTLVALKRRSREFSNCFIAYAEAQDYPPTQKEADASLAQSDSNPSVSIVFLSSGVFDVTLVPELSSCAPAGVYTRLIAFPSLDAHQLMALRAELQPSHLSFIEGVPPAPHNEWRLKAIAAVNHLEEIQNVGQNVQRYQTSTLDYRETLNCLLDLYTKHSIHERLLVSPTGSKMQTVAVGIFRSFLEDIQIVYPTPQDFLKPERYTHSVGAMHLLSLESFSRQPLASALPVPPTPARSLP